MAPLERDSSRANLRISGSSTSLDFGTPVDSSESLSFPRDVSAVLQKSTGCTTDLRDRVNTKLICTIGPSSCSTELLTGLIHAGMTAIRFDFTIGDRVTYDEAVKNLATAVRATGKMVATIVDTNGPTSTVLLEEGEQVELIAGSQVTLTADFNVAASSSVLPISDPRVVKCVKPGDKIVIGKYLASGSDDASAVLEVVKSGDSSVACICHEPATLSGKITCMIVNAPRECIPTMQESDYEELRKWDEHNLVDFVSLSCTRSGEDVLELRKFLQTTHHMQEVQIIAKLESRQGLENFHDILKEADAIMVSRGDLGSSIPVEKLNPIQKYVLHQCNVAAKPCIITRVMDTMQQWPRPTRAEATDVANAVLDGVDCILLGAETVRGTFPVEAARTVLAIAKEAEVVYNNGYQFKKMNKELPTPMPRQMAIASSAVQAANRVGAALIIAITTLGSTPRYAALFRPKVPILSVQLPTLGVDRRTFRWRASGTHKARQTLLSNGVIPVLADPATLDPNKSALKVAIDFGKSLGLCQERDNVVVMQRIQNTRVVSMVQVD